jgi:hypothetical protein
MASAKMDFKLTIADPRVQEILTNPQTSKLLAKVYRHYSAQDRKTGHTVMQPTHFANMLKELNILDKNTKQKDILSIFTEVQDDGTEARGDEAGQNMSFSEFGEAITAIAMWKHPHPLTSVHTKLRTFLDKEFLPTYKAHASTKQF